MCRAKIQTFALRARVGDGLPWSDQSTIKAVLLVLLANTGQLQDLHQTAVWRVGRVGGHLVLAHRTRACVSRVEQGSITSRQG